LGVHGTGDEVNQIKRCLQILIGFLLFMSASAHAKDAKKIVLGFSQIGAESAWRVANTKSVKEAAAEAGITLVFSDAQQNQANQIKAIKTFIMQKVDVIAFSPIVTTGWHDVLMKAKEAKIPVIVLDRQIAEKDRELYTAAIGPDFKLEGKRAAQCLMDVVTQKKLKAPIHVVEIRGTEGSAPATERKAGFSEVLQAHPGYKIIRSENGDFKENLGREVMEGILKDLTTKGAQIQAVFAHNDNMALGAISAIEAAGMKPGKDILIVSVDAIKDAFLAMKLGKLNCTVECSPLTGPQLMKAVQDLVAGKKIPHSIVVEEGVFPQSTADQELPKRKY